MFDIQIKIPYNYVVYTSNDIEEAYHDGVQAERDRIVELIEMWIKDDYMDFDDIYPEIING
jgi:hypothetical protein